MKVRVVSWDPDFTANYLVGEYSSHSEVMAYIRDTPGVFSLTTIEVENGDSDSVESFTEIYDYIVTYCPEVLTYKVDIIAEVFSTPDYEKVREAVHVLKAADLELGIHAHYLGHKDPLPVFMFESTKEKGIGVIMDSRESPYDLLESPYPDPTTGLVHTHRGGNDGSR